MLRKISRERFNAAADQNSSLVEMMTGISTVKAVAAEQDLRWRLEDRLTRQDVYYQLARQQLYL